MVRSIVVALALVALAMPDHVAAQENLQAMSNDELADYLMVKECAADLYVVCLDREIAKQRYSTPDTRRNAVAINRRLDLELFQEEIKRAEDEQGLDASAAPHGHMVRSCGFFSCSWEYVK